MTNIILGQFAGTPAMIGGGILALILFILLIILLNFGMTWLRAKVSGAPVSFWDLIALQLRKIPIRRIVDTRINAVNPA